jgi:hypothetical protein
MAEKSGYATKYDIELATGRVRPTADKGLLVLLLVIRHSAIRHSHALLFDRDRG